MRGRDTGNRPTPFAGFMSEFASNSKASAGHNTPRPLFSSLTPTPSSSPLCLPHQVGSSLSLLAMLVLFDPVSCHRRPGQSVVSCRVRAKRYSTNSRSYYPCSAFSVSRPAFESLPTSLHTFTEDEEMLREAGAFSRSLAFHNPTTNVLSYIIRLT